MNKHKGYLTGFMALLLFAITAVCGGVNNVVYADDVTPPVVVSVYPHDTATYTYVSINGNIIATFNEAMNGKTITHDSFMLMQGSTPVPGKVTWTATSAIFNPTKNLAPNTVYTATVTTGVKDLAGNALASDYVWSFTTESFKDIIAPKVSSVVPADGVTGVAINTSIMATFSETMDPQKSRKAIVLNHGGKSVKGTLSCVGTTAIFKPDSNLLANTVYTVKINANRARDLAGNVSASNFVWKFTTGSAPDTTTPTVSSTEPADAATGVAINANIAATFSEAMNPLTITTTTFTLRQGATPVAGAVNSVGVTAAFKPTNNLAPNTTYTATINTGAQDMAGNALTADFVWSFTTGTTSDTTPPTVSSTVPADAATGVAVNANIAADFSEAMDNLTITTATFTLKQGITPVDGTVTYAGVTATFNPTKNLAANTVYTATICPCGNGAKDLAGNELQNYFIWSFTTGAAPDTTLPTVSSVIPVNASTGVATNTEIEASFSETMSSSTLNISTFTLMQGTTPVAGTVSYVGATAIFRPLSNLASDTMFTATINTGAQELAGNALATDFVWNFTTGATPDATAPMVTLVNPDDFATGVAIDHTVTTTFSEAIDPLTINTENFILTDGANPVVGTVTYDVINNIATFVPFRNLEPSTTYTATVTTGVKDLAGNALASDKIWNFTTGTATGLAQVNLGADSTLWWKADCLPGRARPERAR